MCDRSGRLSACGEAGEEGAQAVQRLARRLSAWRSEIEAPVLVLGHLVAEGFTQRAQAVPLPFAPVHFDQRLIRRGVQAQKCRGLARAGEGRAVPAPGVQRAGQAPAGHRSPPRRR